MLLFFKLWVWKDGNTIPGYVSKQGEDSRVDETTVPTYSDGTWVVEFQRSLVSNNPDNVQFELSSVARFISTVVDELFITPPSPFQS
jgi:hypothetical protein